MSSKGRLWQGYDSDDSDTGSEAGSVEETNKDDTGAARTRWIALSDSESEDDERRQVSNATPRHAAAGVA